MSRSIIVANRDWEADPLVAVLTSVAGAHAAGAPFIPAGKNDPRGLRGRVDDGNGHVVEIRCIKETLPDGALPSSSAEKAKVLPGMLAGDDVRAVIAFGTAARYDDASWNGCVVAGTNVFVHDAKPPQPKSSWPPPHPDEVLSSALDEKAFGALFSMSQPDLAALLKLLLPPPLHPAPSMQFLAQSAFVALSDVNVTDPADYAWADIETIAVFLKQKRALQIGSVETTHGVIRSCTEAPFAFLSGIVDRVGHFEDDVQPLVDAQNFVGAHNAGIVGAVVVGRLLAWMSG
jgi:hypothetical protein